jgi:hypothetical protein
MAGTLGPLADLAEVDVGIDSVLSVVDVVVTIVVVVVKVEVVVAVLVANSMSSGGSGEWSVLHC